MAGQVHAAKVLSSSTKARHSTLPRRVRTWQYCAPSEAATCAALNVFVMTPSGFDFRFPDKNADTRTISHLKQDYCTKSVPQRLWKGHFNTLTHPQTSVLFLFQQMVSHELFPRINVELYNVNVRQPLQGHIIYYRTSV